MPYLLAVIAIMSLATPASAQDTGWTYDRVGGLSCQQFRSLFGKPQYLEASQALSDYLGTKGREAEALGSSCNAMDYVKAECVQSRPPRVREAVDRLLAKVHRGGTLPRIPQCGA